MKMISCQQVHSSKIFVVRNKDVKSPIPNCDGLITNLKKVILSVKTADCLRIAMRDSNKGVVGVIHAGWRGTLLGISKKGVGIFQKIFKSNPEDIRVRIGPGIDKDNYIIKHDVYNRFKKNYVDFFEKVDNDLWRMDLRGINTAQLLDMGIPIGNIKASKISTFKNLNYPSFRRDGKSKGFITKIQVD